MIDLFVGFRVGDSDSKTFSIRQKSHIKSLFINILYQIWNLRYSKHLKITNCVSLKPFILAINLDIMSFSNFLSFWFMCSDIMSRCCK